MDHWNNDTCVGKYLKNIYEQRINKNQKSYDGDRSGQFDVAMYKEYGVNFILILLAYQKNFRNEWFWRTKYRLILKGRIIVINSRDRHYN